MKYLLFPLLFIIFFITLYCLNKNRENFAQRKSTTVIINRSRPNYYPVYYPAREPKVVVGGVLGIILFLIIVIVIVYIGTKYGWSDNYRNSNTIIIHHN